MMRKPRRHKGFLVKFSLFIGFAILFPLLPLQAQSGLGTEGLHALAASKTTARLKSSFSYAPRYPAPGQAIQFTDASTGSPASWAWDFGDGSTSTVQNPSHAFAAKGFFRVVLTVVDGSATRSSRRTIAVIDATNTSLTASFRHNPAYPSTGESVQFTDTSSGNPTSWTWDFGDGSTSTVRNPSHVFTAYGFRTVTLVASDGSKTRSASRRITVRPGTGVVALVEPELLVTVKATE